jgi:hypothetical protein
MCVCSGEIFSTFSLTLAKPREKKKSIRFFPDSTKSIFNPQQRMNHKTHDGALRPLEAAGDLNAAEQALVGSGVGAWGIGCHPA